MNRILLYVHYNKSDDLSSHVLYQLEKLFPLFSRILLISNSYLSTEHLKSLRKIGINEVVQRENIGYDFAAWRDGMNYIGFNSLVDYDSVTLMNDTCIGPLWDLQEYFEKFEKQVDIDFWGMTNFRKTKYFKEHLQSYFVSYSRQVVSSKVFQKFWTSIRDYENIRSVIDRYETRFTGILTKSGFKYGVVFNTINEDAGNLIHPDFSYYRPEEILNQQVPFIKVKVFQVNSEQTNYIKSQINNLTDFPMSVLNEQLISNVYCITDATVENKDFISRIKKLVRRIFRK